MTAPTADRARARIYAAYGGLARALTLGVLALAVTASLRPAFSQAIDMTKGGPITVTSQGGIEWRQQSQEVIADQDAKAVRGTVTVTANQLIAHYRKKAATPGQPAAPAAASNATDTGSSEGLQGDNEIYLLEAQGNVNIFTPTDRATGDHGAYDMDQGVLVLTGHDLKLTTPTYVVTATNSLEYWSNQHMAVARGNAVLVTNTGRRIAADVLVAYTSPTSGPATTGAAAAKTTVVAKTGQTAAQPDATDPTDPSGSLKLVDGIGHVVIMTATDIVQGDRAVYDPTLGIARIAGHVHITRGQNELVGSEALVNMKTGISRLLSHSRDQVKGLIMPNQAGETAQTGQIHQAPGARAPAALAP
ncbi:LptA/OstA family protein [Acidisoma sp.]|uniref:LptA/OstA family protein n=1 Tax=Acidisoma sp. TaxID=1872115 RepID=UPI003AFFF8DF